MFRGSCIIDIVKSMIWRNEALSSLNNRSSDMDLSLERVQMRRFPSIIILPNLICTSLINWKIVKTGYRAMMPV